MLVIEGSVASEKIKKEGYWTGYGTDDSTGQPITLAIGTWGSHHAHRGEPESIRACSCHYGVKDEHDHGR